MLNELTTIREAPASVYTIWFVYYFFQGMLRRKLLPEIPRFIRVAGIEANTDKQNTFMTITYADGTIVRLTAEVMIGAVND